jgi:hypothetical protein
MMSGTCSNSIGNEAMPVLVHHPNGVGGSLASAVNSNSLGVGYSGSGFLIFYFVGKQTCQADGGNPQHCALAHGQPGSTASLAVDIMSIGGTNHTSL